MGADSIKTPATAGLQLVSHVGTDFSRGVVHLLLETRIAR